MASNNVKVIKYIGLSSSKVKYPVTKTVIGTIIKANGPYYRIKPEIGRIVEIAKSSVLEVNDK